MYDSVIVETVMTRSFREENYITKISHVYATLLHWLTTSKKNHIWWDDSQDDNQAELLCFQEEVQEMDCSKSDLNSSLFQLWNFSMDQSQVNNGSFVTSRCCLDTQDHDDSIFKTD